MGQVGLPSFDGHDRARSGPKVRTFFHSGSFFFTLLLKPIHGEKFDSKYYQLQE